MSDLFFFFFFTWIGLQCLQVTSEPGAAPTCCDCDRYGLQYAPDRSRGHGLRWHAVLRVILGASMGRGAQAVFSPRKLHNLAPPRNTKDKKNLQSS